jgi:hypothetical protein
MQIIIVRPSIATVFVGLLTTMPATAMPIVFSGSGSSPAGIEATVDAFHADLGSLNPNVPG